MELSYRKNWPVIGPKRLKLNFSMFSDIDRHERMKYNGNFVNVTLA